MFALASSQESCSRASALVGVADVGCWARTRRVPDCGPAGRSCQGETASAAAEFRLTPPTRSLPRIRPFVSAGSGGGLPASCWPCATSVVVVPGAARGLGPRPNASPRRPLRPRGPVYTRHWLARKKSGNPLTSAIGRREARLRGSPSMSFPSTLPRNLEDPTGWSGNCANDFRGRSYKRRWFNMAAIVCPKACPLWATMHQFHDRRARAVGNTNISHPC